VDYLLQRRLGNQFQNLDRALARGDRLAADFARIEINRLLAEAKPPANTTTEDSIANRLPAWMRDIVNDQGLRVPAIERAFSVNRAVVSPTFGKAGYGLQIELKF
jgi:hypothetical protein